MRQIIHIFGAAGSGTSTLGRAICEELGYRFMDTDDYFWLPTNPEFTQKRPRGERIRMMQEDIQTSDHVVISGALTDWGDVLIPQFTLAIRLVTDTEVRIARLEQRERARFGERIAPGGDMYQQHLDFIQWARAYDTGSLDMRSKAEHDVWQKLLRCRLLVLNGDAKLEDNLVQVKQALSE